MKLASPGNFQTFKDALTSHPRLNVEILREKEDYAAQSQTLVKITNFLAGTITTPMGLGAIFGALNTMYTAVSARAREIATLEAIGFSGSPILVSVLIESMLLAVIGGTIGAIGAWLAFDGFPAATLNWQTFSQVTFSFDVQRRAAHPRLRAARMPVAVSLRER